MEKTKLKIILTVVWGLFATGAAIAHCGKCDTKGADGSKACPANCQKACRQKAKKATNFALKDIHGKTVKLSQFKGKMVVLEWTNQNCPFVKAHYADSARTMSRLAAKYANQGVVWLTIDSTKSATAEKVRAWAQSHQLKHQIVLLDTTGKVGKQYKAKTTPHLFIINKQGEIVYDGAIDNAPLGKKPEDKKRVNYVDKALSELLSGKKVETPKTKPYGCSVKYAK